MTAKQIFDFVNGLYKKYPVLAPITWVVLSGIAWIISNNKYVTKFEAMAASVDQIKSDTSILAHNLKVPTEGGTTVTIGVNPREVFGGDVYVTKGNDHKLKYGDVITLQNFADNRFQAQLRFQVKDDRSMPGSSPSQAQIFISKEAAQRIGFENFAHKGILQVKMRKLSSIDQAK